MCHCAVCLFFPALLNIIVCRCQAGPHKHLAPIVKLLQAPKKTRLATSPFNIFMGAPRREKRTKNNNPALAFLFSLHRTMQINYNQSIHQLPVIRLNQLTITRDTLLTLSGSDISSLALLCLSIGQTLCHYTDARGLTGFINTRCSPVFALSFPRDSNLNASLHLHPSSSFLFFFF